MLASYQHNNNRSQEKCEVSPRQDKERPQEIFSKWFPQDNTEQCYSYMPFIYLLREVRSGMDPNTADSGPWGA